MWPGTPNFGASIKCHTILESPATGMARAFRNGKTLDARPKIGGSRPHFRFL